MIKTTPILLLTGYLGSGKTTLVNHILTNERGIKFAVIVNDIGEVNIDADLIQKGGIVDTKDDSLVALQNGCICCTLKTDLMKQIDDILMMGKFDYIVIEASGICEPMPIAQTICTMQQQSLKYSGVEACRLDSIVSVVDALRLQSEFGCGNNLVNKKLEGDDIENLIIQQIEFCNIILLNKASEVQPEELERIKAIIRVLQPQAQIIECDYANVDIPRIINTHLFDLSKVATSAGWVKEFDRDLTEEEEAEREGHHHHHHHHDDEHEHHHHHHHDGEECDDPDCECHHHHHHDDDDHDHDHEDHSHCDHEHGVCHCGHHHDHNHPHGDEYGISTFVYYRRPAFDLDKFDAFVFSKWPRNVIRAKGICYFKQNPDMAYVFEQAGVQKKVTESGQWYATAPEDELKELIENDPLILKDWDEEYGDRMQKLVFIGQHLDKEQLIADLDACLAKK
ncbi:MAG: GTP-binding protein [Salinivirgaceae bacterium]|nr:GTP-binding protein [Salinivirgaceae bacterium]